MCVCRFLNCISVFKVLQKGAVSFRYLIFENYVYAQVRLNVQIVTTTRNFSK